MGSKYFIDALNTGVQEVAVAGGADAEVKLTEGSNTWNIKHNGTDSDLELLYNTEERLSLAEDGSQLTLTADTAADAMFTVAVDSGQDASVTLQDGSASWSLYSNGAAEDFELRRGANARLSMSKGGDQTTIDAGAGLDVDLELACDSGQDASLTLQEGTNDWQITNDGATGRLAVSYNTSEAFAISDDLFPVFPEYTVASLPTGEAGGMIMVTDETGGYVPAFYDGTNWRRVTDRAIVS